MRVQFPADHAAEPSWLTVPLSYVYRAGLAINQGWRRARRWKAAVPVISVGGLTAGGSGKTPTVIALHKLLCEIDSRLSAPNMIGILSRGYGRSSSGLVHVRVNSEAADCGDEPLLIKRSCPAAAVIVHRSRRVAARYATEQLETKLLLLDDGFQHVQLARTIDLVLVDGANPWGNHYLLPAGPLREPKSALRRADAVLSVRTPSRELIDYGSEIEHVLTTVEVDSHVPADIVHKNCLVFCGIARPERLFGDLALANVIVKERVIFPDHYPYTQDVLKMLQRKMQELAVDWLVTTAKDAVRLPPNWLPEKLRIVGIEHKFCNLERMRELMDRCLSQIVWAV